jgi:hypothetical protein
MMRIETIAIAILLASPFAVAQVQDEQSALLYRQVVRNGDISVALITDPKGIDLKPYLAEVASALKAGGVKWPGSDAPKILEIEATLNRDGLLSKLIGIRPNRTHEEAARLGTTPAKFLRLLDSADFPPLPESFSGDRIIVRFIFTAGAGAISELAR